MFDPITASPEQLLAHVRVLDNRHADLMEHGSELKELADYYDCRSSRHQLEKVSLSLSLVEAILEESEPFVRILH